MGTFTSDLNLLVSIIEHDPVVCDQYLPIKLSQQLNFKTQEVLDRLTGNDLEKDVDMALVAWGNVLQKIYSMRNPCPLGTLVRLISVGLIQTVDLAAINSIRRVAFSRFSQLGLTFNPQYYFLFEIYSRTVTFVITPGVMPEEDIHKELRRLLYRGERQHLVEFMNAVSTNEIRGAI